MPEICRFGGIIIYMYADDHLPPHFHAKYGGEEAQVSIGDCAVTRGHLAPRAERMVIAWAKQRTAELELAWERAKRREDPGRIAPPG